MSGLDSPSKWSSGAENILLSEHVDEDVTLKMKVPHSIKANGDIVEDDYHHNNGYAMSWMNNSEKFNMNVPDRIMLMGQDQHLGTRAPPREIVLENSVMGRAMTGPDDVRVSTPPRTITLEHHTFPSATESPLSSPTVTSHAPLVLATPPPLKNRKNNMVLDTRITPYRESSPPENTSMIGEESVVLLRRQVAGINRRVMALEMELVDRQQKERFVCALGIAYLIYKVISWLNRS